MKKRRYLDLMVQNRHLSQYSPDDKTRQNLQRLRHSAPLTRNRAPLHQDVVIDNQSGISPSASTEESQPQCEEKTLRKRRQNTEMPCRCKSVGEGSVLRVSPISPCLITQSGTIHRKSSNTPPKQDPQVSDHPMKSSTGTLKNSPDVFDHHRKPSTATPKPNRSACDLYKRSPSLTPKYDIAVFDHLKSSLQERHKTIVKRNKPRSSSKSQPEEEKHEEVFKDKKSLKLRFKMAAKCVLVLIRWLNAIIDISDTKTIRTATEERWYTLYTSQEARRLAFNKMVYSKERAFAKVPKWASDIFESDPDSRSEQDCRRIHALLRGLKSFDKFTERIQLYMCRAFRYQSVEPGRVILRRGHVGINFYFIYSGSVFVNVEEVNTRGEHFEKTETVLVRGDSFGELALLQDIRRTATITCRETCEILVVDKETFAKVCPSIFQEELEEKEKFLSKLNLFSPKFWTKEMLKTLCNEAQIQEYKTNKVVATDRSDEEWIYICMQGKGQVVRRLLLDGPSTSKRQRIKSTRTSSRHKSTEVLVNLLDDEPDSQSSSVTSEESDDEESKEKMLESMSLEYRKDGRRASFLTHLKWEAEIQRRKAMKTPHRDDSHKKKQEMLFTGPMTLTSLMSKDKENKASDHIYLQLDSLFKEDVFDMYSIMHNVTSPPDSDVLLVSGGGRFLRIKKKNFFHVCSREGLDHARRIASSVRYPTDNQLLAAYTEKFHWDHYKHLVVDHVIRDHVERKTRFKNSPQIQASIISYQRQKTLDLINTLKAHSH